MRDKLGTSCDMEIISVCAMKTKYHERNFDIKCAFSDAYFTLDARFFTETSNYMN